MNTPCSAYRNNDRICANGFYQKPFCRGSIGCFSCGAISERSIPHCLNEDIPSQFLDEAGRPCFAPRPDGERP